MNIANLFTPQSLEFVAREFNEMLSEDIIPTIVCNGILLVIHPDGWEPITDPNEFWVRYLKIEFPNGYSIEGEWIEDFEQVIC